MLDRDSPSPEDRPLLEVTPEDVTPVRQAHREVPGGPQRGVAVVDVSLQLELPSEGLATVCAGPQVDPVVELGELRQPVHVPQGVQRTLEGQPHLGRQLGDDGHQGLQGDG